MVLFQDGAEPLRHSHGDTAGILVPMRMISTVDMARSRERMKSRVPSDRVGDPLRDQHVPYLGGPGDIVKTAADLVLRPRGVVLAGETSPRAVAAVHGALVRDEKDAPVGVPVGQSGTESPHPRGAGRGGRWGDQGLLSVGMACLRMGQSGSLPSMREA